MTKSISFEQIASYQRDLAQTPGSTALAKAVQNVGPLAASRAQLDTAALSPVFSDEVTTGSVTNQKQSGRCWLFSELNTMRHYAGEKLGIEDLEFSQAYLAFYDRLEKANLFLEHILETATKPLTDRTVAEYLASPDEDGGQFDNAAALIAKYGIVPKSVMPETFHSSRTAALNQTLQLKLRKDAIELRAAVADNASADDLQALKQTQLSTIYRILAYAYGEPTQTFDFEYRDKDKQYHLDRDLTPKSFYDKYVGWDLDEYVTLVSTPEAGKDYYQPYHLPSQDTVVGGRPLTFVNVPREDLEKAAIAQIQSGETVWFGNDVGQNSERKSGTLQGNLYDLSSLFGTDLTLDKANRFATHEAEVTHAMVLTGVNLVDGQPTKWKVENSWGKENGHDGYFVADQQWFEDYAYEVVVKKSLLTPEITAALEKEAITLPAWGQFALIVLHYFMNLSSVSKTKE